MSSQSGADTPERQASTQATNTGLDEDLVAALSYPARMAYGDHQVHRGIR